MSRFVRQRIESNDENIPSASYWICEDAIFNPRCVEYPDTLTRVGGRNVGYVTEKECSSNCLKKPITKALQKEIKSMLADRDIAAHLAAGKYNPVETQFPGIYEEYLWDKKLKSLINKRKKLTVENDEMIVLDNEIIQILKQGHGFAILWEIVEWLNKFKRHLSSQEFALGMAILTTPALLDIIEHNPSGIFEFEFMTDLFKWMFSDNSIIFKRDRRQWDSKSQIYEKLVDSTFFSRPYLITALLAKYLLDKDLQTADNMLLDRFISEIFNNEEIQEEFINIEKAVGSFCTPTLGRHTNFLKRVFELVYVPKDIAFRFHQMMAMDDIWKLFYDDGSITKEEKMYKIMQLIQKYDLFNCVFFNDNNNLSKNLAKSHDLFFALIHKYFPKDMTRLDRETYNDWKNFFGQHQITDPVIMKWWNDVLPIIEKIDKDNEFISHE